MYFPNILTQTSQIKSLSVHRPRQSILIVYQVRADGRSCIVNSLLRVHYYLSCLFVFVDLDLNLILRFLGCVVDVACRSQSERCLKQFVELIAIVRPFIYFFYLCLLLRVVVKLWLSIRFRWQVVIGQAM